MKRLVKEITKLLPDKLYIGMQYIYYTKERLDLEKPRGFNEKLQWLKIYDRNPLYTKLSDKYHVRDFITSKVGDKYLIPLIDVYQSVEDIKWGDLPEKFVLKCNHGSGSNIICKDRNLLEINNANRKLKKWMNTNYYYSSREWPYKNIKPIILCETYLSDDIYDYKFYCFNGNPRFLYVAQGDNAKGTLKMNFYDLHWNKCSFYRKDHDPLLQELRKPENFDEMIEIAKQLSKDVPFIRVDMYNLSGKIYVGELTLYPGGGLTPFFPEEYERDIGNWIKLPLE